MPDPARATGAGRAWADTAAALAAGSYGLGGAPIRFLTESENWTYLLTPDGASSPGVLRVYRPGSRTDAEIVSELTWMRALAADTDLLLPQVLHDAQGRLLVRVAGDETQPGAQCVLFSHIAGQEPDDAELPERMGRIGALTGQLHAHSRGWLPPPGFARPTWDVDHTLGPKARWGPWTAGVADAEERRQLQRLADTVVHRLGRFGAGSARFGLVHGDLRMSNVLVDRDDRLAFIDFDDSGYGWFLYDLATTLTFNEGHAHRDEMVATWLEAYRQHAPVPVEDEAEIETFFMTRRLMVSAWFGSHADTDTARQYSPGFATETCDLAESYLVRVQGARSRSPVRARPGSTAPAGRPPQQPYIDRKRTIEAFDEYVQVNRGRYLRELGADLVIGARQGGRFQDAFTEKWYWNLHCNGGVFNVGHRNARLAEVLRDALDTLDIGNHHFISGFRAKAAERLVRTTRGALAGVAFTTTGSEAVDLAIRLARGITGRHTVIGAEGAYHGHVGLALAMTKPEWQYIYGPSLPSFRQVPWNDLAAMERAIDGDTAAVLLESIPATMGFPMPDPGYLREVERLCRERGAMFMLDEVQTGLGRTGTMWYWQQEDVVPDVFVTGKGLSGGLFPIAAAVLGQRAFDFLAQHPFGHVSTYGGSDLGCVVVSELLEMVDDPTFLRHVRDLSAQFEDGLRGAPFEFRHRGLTGAFQLRRPDGGHEAMRRLLDHGVWAIFSTFDRSTVQFKPVLTLTRDEADEVISAIRAALG